MAPLNWAERVRLPVKRLSVRATSQSMLQDNAEASSTKLAKC